jgi:hypothetical protein
MPVHLPWKDKIGGQGLLCPRETEPPLPMPLKLHFWRLWALGAVRGLEGNLSEVPIVTQSGRGWGDNLERSRLWGWQRPLSSQARSEGTVRAGWARTQGPPWQEREVLGHLPLGQARERKAFCEPVRTPPSPALLREGAEAQTVDMTGWPSPAPTPH